MISFDRERILALCQKYGPLLRVPPDIDGPRLMGAIAANESSLGANCGPRHEPAYDVGGIYAGEPTQASLLRQYGSAAACSYGPWQVMLDNCPGYSPEELETDPETCARAFASYFNAYVIRQHGGSNIEQIGQIYNAGHILAHPGPGVKAYCLELQHHYDTMTFAKQEAQP